MKIIVHTNTKVINCCYLAILLTSNFTNLVNIIRVNIVVPNANFHKKRVKSNQFQKPSKLSKCDIDILKILRNGSVEVLKIHEKLLGYSDQEVSLNLSWLEQKNFIKKAIFVHPLTGKTVSYQLDSLGKEFIYKG